MSKAINADKVVQKEEKPLPEQAEELEGGTIDTCELTQSMKSITGIGHEGTYASILFQAASVNIAVYQHDLEIQLEIAGSKLAAIAPRDVMEGLLASQMVQAADMAADCMRRAAIPEQHPEAREDNINQAVKLMRVYREGMEALDKRRGKGQQKITVEHVTVNEGGQAIVGEVHHGGRGSKK